MSLKAYLSTHLKANLPQSLTSVVFGERLRKFRDLLNLTHNTSNRRKPVPCVNSTHASHMLY